jgi:hypothetical protein
MFEATKKLIEHCKHLGLTADIFARPLYEAAEKEIAQIESQLTPRAADECPASSDKQHEFYQGSTWRICAHCGTRR